MTHEEFISLVKNPELVNSEKVADLKELVELYPYFVPARLFLLKALKESNSIHFAANLKIASLYCLSRRWLYYYLHPEKKLTSEPYKREKTSKFSGDYFDMINVVESQGGDTKQSLKILAERLKSARRMVIVSSEKPKVNLKVEEKMLDRIDFKITNNIIEKNPRIDDITESNTKKLIHEKKYKEAIEILKVLNLNNPKKSVYFADQIRFLEKVIANSKK